MNKYFTEDELCGIYRGCKYPNEQIRTIMQLGSMTEDEVKDMLLRHGYTIPKTPDEKKKGGILDNADRKKPSNITRWDMSHIDESIKKLEDRINAEQALIDTGTLTKALLANKRSTISRCKNKINDLKTYKSMINGIIGPKK